MAAVAADAAASSREPWPWKKFDEAVQQRVYGTPAVMVATGSFSPMHRGHLWMMAQARERLERAGFEVLGGWLSLSSDHESLAQARQNGAFELSGAFRLRIGELMVGGEDLSVAAWETPPLGGCFKVVDSLQEEVARRWSTANLRGHLHAFLVCGSDKASQCLPRLPAVLLKRQGIVVVPREGDNLILEKPHQLFYVAEPCAETLTMSSTKVRAAISSGDTSYIKEAMNEPAARFLITPEERERTPFQVDFNRLAMLPADDGPWPCSKFLRRLEDCPRDCAVAVLVATGTFSPAHRGHVLMLHQAAERLGRAGYEVAGAWISLLDDDMAAQEARVVDAPALSAAFRRRVAEYSVCDDDLVSVAAYEVTSTKGKLPAPLQVAKGLRSYLEGRFSCSLMGRRLKIFYVGGGNSIQKHGLLNGLEPQHELGVVAVTDNGEDVFLEMPRQLVYVADPVPGEANRFCSTKLREAILRGDIATGAQVMAPAAARFVLAPTDAERQAMLADFARLAIKQPDTPAMDEARVQLKGTIRAWVGPKGTVHTEPLAKLLRLLDPSWTSEELAELMAGVSTGTDGNLSSDDFVDRIFACSRK